MDAIASEEDLAQRFEAALHRDDAALHRFQQDAVSGVLRDAAPFPPAACAALWRAVQQTWHWRGRRSEEERTNARRRKQLVEIVLTLLQYPEWSWGEEVESAVTQTFVFEFLQLIQSSANAEEDEEVLFLILYTVYRDASGFARMRLRRDLIGKACREFVRFPHRNFCVAAVVRVLGFIVEGQLPALQAAAEAGEVEQDETTTAAGDDGSCNLRPDSSTRANLTSPPWLAKLAKDVLFPLHQTNKWHVWDRQLPLLKLYHAPLVKILERCVAFHERFLEDALKNCSRAWPPPTEANTAKEVLLLQEMRTLLKSWATAAVGATSTADEGQGKHKHARDRERSRKLQLFRERLAPAIFSRILSCVKSLNAQVVECALLFWKDEAFCDLLFANEAGLVEHWLGELLPELWREELFWNPTVNRMTALVLEKFRQRHGKLLDDAAREVWEKRQLLSHARRNGAAASSSTQRAAAEAKSGGPGPAAPFNTLPPVANKTLGLDASNMAPGVGSSVGSVGKQMREWRQGGCAAGPPSTITGVAPWARGGGGGMPGRPGPLSKQPPATITGVAPWLASSHSRGASGGSGAGPLSAKLGGQGIPPMAGGVGGALRGDAIMEIDEDEDEGGGGGVVAGREAETGSEGNVVGGDPAKRALEDYVKKLNPIVDHSREWDDQLLSLTPTWLPDLKFHDVVYGSQDLGRGAFSVVRYGRTVVKNKTQSQWPEYAVKVISLETIQKNNYVHQVNQEIGILKHLSHPNICRLVSAFRWRDGAYLVLEYCSQGDLHSYVLNQGALSAMASFLFTAGEIVAGLTAVHEQGFAFGDMKPENVVITASGHCKLTDFGGARALTEDAQAKLQGELESASGMHVAGLRRGEHASELQRGGAEKAAPSRNASAETDHDLATSIWEAQGKAPAGVDGVAGLLTCSAPPSEHQQLGQEAASEQQTEVTDKKMTFEGTGAYMAPELVLQRGRTPNAQSDAWALGCTLFFLRTSRLPFWAATEDEMVDALARFCSAGDISHAEVGDAASRGGGLSFSDEQGSKRDALRRLAQTCADSEDKDREGLLSFVAALFKEDPDERAKVVEVAHDSTHWLNSSVPGKSCLNLYKQPRGLLRNGNAFAASSSSGGAAGGDADPWAKRQFSKIWTVMASEVEMGAAGGFGSVRQGLYRGPTAAYLNKPLTGKSAEELTGEF